MAQTTRATLALKARGVAFETRVYDYDPGAERVGMQAALALGEPPARVLKTLVALVDGAAVCLVLPSDQEASMKKVAKLFGGKGAAMAPAPEAERITGYKVGGVSPLGQRKKLPVAIEETCLGEAYVFVNGGQRGLQIRLAPADLVAATEARTASLVTTRS